ncbi:MAG: hypothetical protein QM778_13840 [Myxococcales bacterium]
MIQQAPHRRSNLLFTATILGVAACGGAAPQEPIPRSLEGQTQVSSFVPPFAYEAYVRGEMAIAKGAFDEAAAQLELATAAPEEDPFLLARLAYAQARSGHAEDAAATLAHAMQLDTCPEAVWLTRGELAELAGDLPHAEQAYAKAGECAPSSARGPIAHARVLARTGQPSAALEALASFRGKEQPATARVAFEIALQGTDPALLAHSLETWIAYEAPDAESLERAARWALEHGDPSLSVRLREHHAGPFPKALEASIMRALGERSALRLLLSGALAEELGGSQATAELALFAGALERAELEASSALDRAPNDALYAVRAQARFGLGLEAQALADLRAIRDPARQHETALALLAASGKPALAAELGALRPTAQ